MVNLDASVQLAELAVRRGCRRFVHASSCSVYGAAGDALLTEDSPARPVTLYAQYKLRVEEVLNGMAGPAFVPVHLRQATLFGHSPRMRWDLAVNAMTADALHGGRIVVRGGGRQWRPFLHVRDAADAFAAVLAAPDAAVGGAIFNLGGGPANHQIIDVAEIVRSCVPHARVLVTLDEASAISYRVLSDRIARRLGWRAQRSVEHGVGELLEVLRNGVGHAIGGRAQQR